MPSHRSWSLCLLGLGTTLRVRVNLVNLFNHVNVGYRYHEGGGTWRDVDTVTLMATDEPREVKDLSSGDVASTPPGSRDSNIEFTIAPIKTTIPFHLKLLENVNFVKGDFSTHFVQEMLKSTGGEE